MKKAISNVGFYPIVLEKDEAEELENDPAKMGARFEAGNVQACARMDEAGRGKTRSPSTSLSILWPVMTTCHSIDKVVDEFKSIRNPDMKHFEMEGGYEVVGLSNANLTPWLCARDVDEQELTRKLDELWPAMIQKPERTIASSARPTVRFRPGYLSRSR